MLTQQRHPRLFSFEFYPPKSQEGAASLRAVQDQLATLHPDFFSVTFGAGGSTRDRTFETVCAIQQRGIAAAPHLSCVGATRDSLRELIHAYRAQGVTKIVALRGDLPSGMMSMGEFRYANELVEFIREETGAHFQIHVAAYPETHPQAPNARADLLNFKRKVEAGADAAITQYFYNADAYCYFVDACEKLGLDLPIVPGIMPITNFSQLARFSETCGAEIPRWLRKRLEAYGDDRQAICEFGSEVATELCRKLLAQGAPGLHFYTMNQAAATLAIWRNLDL